MPCFKGLAISIHAPDGPPLPEYSIQRQSRRNRITSYIPVPSPKARPDAPGDVTEQSAFAISITLLTPGQAIPYTNNVAASGSSSPLPPVAGGTRERNGRASSPIVRAYSPFSQSSNETVAAYIYFDGRTKEEVATLLRRGEETWVNSRWVSIPESEGGGLAEREFLFREVGLERWLNGLDLEGKDKDVAAKIERRKERMERRQRWRQRGEAGKRSLGGMDMDRGGDDDEGSDEMDKLRDALDKLDSHSDDDGHMLLYSSDSESEPPPPEAAGQIKIALFRVMASGEIKRGEYSPQYDAHDDDEPELDPSNQVGSSNGDQAEIEHTTSFAEPKSLDPRSISTQTVTGIDPPESPYATFTFLYRSERQLQKMGIIKSDEKASSTPNKRRSTQMDFSKLAPLKVGGAMGFSTFRDSNSMSPTAGHSAKGKKRNSRNDDDDSDDDGEDVDVVGKVDEIEGDEKAEGIKMLSVEDTQRQGELAEGVRKIKLKRAHSAEPLHDSAPRKATTAAASNPPTATQTPQQPSITTFLEAAGTPPTTYNNNNNHHNSSSSTVAGDNHQDLPYEGMIGSPMKRSRPSLADSDDNPIRRRLGLGLLGGVVGSSGGGENEGSTVFPRALFGAEDSAATAAAAVLPPQQKKERDEDL
ncbi:MAG: hypothetical protein M1816_001570 [Peltula sp. TS41687]|nr:MAG: hypothetical protein M1816_001570 [Peltula sp. TS41687]